MSDNQQPPVRPGPGNGAIALAIIAAAFILAWASPSPVPRYQLAAGDGSVVRLDTDSGAILACGTTGCRQVQPPDRARTFGPIGIQVGEDEAPQLPANSP